MIQRETRPWPIVIAAIGGVAILLSLNGGAAQPDASAGPASGVTFARDWAIDPTAPGENMPPV
ncbi:MAG TPA: hypothetical protein VGO08_11825, partial [Burkholderiales bacterium]|nr:hypothetical protein [Burkholderiales bacterium]